jgi:hypothetical protein
MFDGQRRKSANAKPFSVSACVLAAFFIKLAKHLALIACLLIIGRSTGRFTADELVIFLTVLSAALLHTIGRILHRRLSFPFHRWFEP